MNETKKKRNIFIRVNKKKSKIKNNSRNHVNVE